MHPWFTKNCIFRPIYQLRNEPVFSYRKEISDYHKTSYEEMTGIQQAKLKILLDRAYGDCPYYKGLFDNQSIRIGDIIEYSQFSKIPFLTKQILKDKFQMILSTRHERVSPRKTSGSTGIPLWLLKDRTATAYMDALMYEVYEWHGIKMGEKQGRFWGLPLDKKTRVKWKLKDRLFNRRRISSFDLSEVSCIRAYYQFSKFRPKYIYGYPSAICEFIRVLENNKISPANLKISKIISTGEMLYDSQRATIEDSFDARLINEYGNTENGIIAFECRAGNMHTMTHNLLIEIVDPINGKTLKNGQLGEIILTELHSFSLPFIRYKTGDLAAIERSKCKCGLQTPIIKQIQGRVSDLAFTADGRKISGPIVNYIMTKGIERFRVIQKTVNSILVLVEAKPGIKQNQLDEIEKKWKSLLGLDIEVRIEVVDKLPLDTSGKLRSFISEINE